jgi:FkbM family methyltransferase
MEAKTKYIILSKDNKDPIINNEKNQFVFINKSLTYLLPSVNHDYYVRNGLFESNLIDFCKNLCNMDGSFLDIGAHTGTYAISLASHVKKVYAFEPQRMTYYALCGGVALSGLHNIECICKGLGSNEQIGKQVLNLISSDGGGSTLQNVEQQILAKEIIEVELLDNMNIEEPICLIKMDVEGNELSVLKGGVEMLKKHNYPKILFESNYHNVELFDFLSKDLNYNILNILGVSNMFLANH